MKTKIFFLLIILVYFLSQTKSITSTNLENFFVITYNNKIKPTPQKWGHSWSISKELFDYVRKVLPEGETMLEMGSGWASGQFSKHYIVYSVEHDKEWVDKYDTNYIYAPIINQWYNTKILETELPKKYGLILVDGPPGPPGGVGRDGFYTNLYLFNTDVIIIFDDVHRKSEYNLMVKVSKKLQREFTIYKDSCGKKFGVINAKNN